jgi:hypothetical protein
MTNAFSTLFQLFSQKSASEFQKPPINAVSSQVEVPVHFPQQTGKRKRGRPKNIDKDTNSRQL